MTPEYILKTAINDFIVITTAATFVVLNLILYSANTGPNEEMPGLD
jgi:hypothetical protein